MWESMKPTFGRPKGLRGERQPKQKALDVGAVEVRGPSVGLDQPASGARCVRLLAHRRLV